MANAERIANIEQEMARTQKNKAVSSFRELASCDEDSLVQECLAGSRVCVSWILRVGIFSMRAQKNAFYLFWSSVRNGLKHKW
jgi:hypothetical protein